MKFYRKVINWTMGNYQSKGFWFIVYPIFLYALYYLTIGLLKSIGKSIGFFIPDLFLVAFLVIYVFIFRSFKKPLQEEYFSEKGYNRIALSFLKIPKYASIFYLVVGIIMFFDAVDPARQIYRTNLTTFGFIFYALARVVQGIFLIAPFFMQQYVKQLYKTDRIRLYKEECGDYIRSSGYTEGPPEDPDEYFEFAAYYQLMKRNAFGENARFITNAIIPKGGEIDNFAETDLIAVTNRGLVFCEMKNYSRQVDVDLRMKEWRYDSNERPYFFSPVLQNHLHIIALRDFMKSFFIDESLSADDLSKADEATREKISTLTQLSKFLNLIEKGDNILLTPMIYSLVLFSSRTPSTFSSCEYNVNKFNYFFGIANVQDVNDGAGYCIEFIEHIAGMQGGLAGSHGAPCLTRKQVDIIYDWLVEHIVVPSPEHRQALIQSRISRNDRNTSLIE